MRHCRARATSCAAARARSGDHPVRHLSRIRRPPDGAAGRARAVLPFARGRAGRRIVDYRLRHPDHKRASVEAFRALNFHVTAAGDSHNDIAMLKAADAGVLFRAPAAVRRAHPGFAAVEDYEALRDAIRNCGQA